MISSSRGSERGNTPRGRGRGRGRERILSPQIFIDEEGFTMMASKNLIHKRGGYIGSSLSSSQKKTVNQKILANMFYLRNVEIRTNKLLYY